MRRVIAGVASAALTIGLLGIQPAGATHCDGVDPACPNPISVAILEGIGYVCNAADVTTNKVDIYEGLYDGTLQSECSYGTDAFWSESPEEWDQQGLTWPGAGPPAVGPFSFLAGPAVFPPESICVSSIGGPGCIFDSFGMLFPGSSGFGAYCGSSEGMGFSTFSAADDSLITGATFGWDQSAATILPLVGEVVASTPEGGEGATVVGFTSSRGTDGGGNCNINQVTTGFNVEGMIVTF